MTIPNLIQPKAMPGTGDTLAKVTSPTSGSATSPAETMAAVMLSRQWQAFLRLLKTTQT